MNPAAQRVLDALASGHGRFIENDIVQFKRLTRFPHTEPWWGKQKRYRFDDPQCEFGVTYVAEELDVVFAETILHEEGAFVDGSWLVGYDKVDERSIVYYTHPDTKSKLKLFDLTGVQLKALGLNNDICSADNYLPSQEVSRIVHENVPDADGIYYVSRQLNTEHAAALFERSGVRCTSAKVKLTAHPMFHSMIERLNVTVMPPRP